MWSSFNDLYRRDTRFSGSDRDVLSAIQALPSTDPFVVAFDSICATDDQRIDQSVRQIQDAATRGFASYEATTRFSALVAEVASNPILGPLVWTGSQARPAGRSTRQLPLLHISSPVYISWYRALRASEAEPNGMVDPSISVQEALAHYGISSDCSAFFLAAPKLTRSANIASILRNQLATEPNFSTLLSGISSSRTDWVPATRFAIALELLYLVRNNVMHGALDPTDMRNDLVGKVAYDVLFSWLLEVSK